MQALSFVKPGPLRALDLRRPKPHSERKIIGAEPWPKPHLLRVLNG
jgi:hypothetical protein